MFEGHVGGIAAPLSLRGQYFVRRVRQTSLRPRAYYFGAVFCGAVICIDATLSTPFWSSSTAVVSSLFRGLVPSSECGFGMNAEVPITLRATYLRFDCFSSMPWSFVEGGADPVVFGASESHPSRVKPRLPPRRTIHYQWP
ncbi:hypothetical protein EV421DRAFT_1741371 [Armillaria borealis]|uniref:Uncharacterized protein n=1 Tax=Armillaria borealis TaxID=47425 RepID=A0AA39MH58_9AGAR|nr:hypothetical protein EV421DRAFT_1741371 [Armillaria borealis]